MRARDGGSDRLGIFRHTLTGLLDSLEATVSMGRANEVEVPAPIVADARQIVPRLGAANRLAASRFSGTAGDSARVRAFAEAVQRLDATYVAYLQVRPGNASDADRAMRALETEISRGRAAL